MDLHTPLSKAGRIYKMYAARLERLDIFSIEDFFYHLPSRYEDFSLTSQINRIQPGETVTVQGHIRDFKNQYLRSTRIKTIQKAVLADDTGTIELIWFNQPFLQKSLQKNAHISVSGRVEKTNRSLQMHTPEYEILYTKDGLTIHTGRLIAVYPETKGVSSKWLRRQIHNIFEQYGNQLIEYLPPHIINEHKFPLLKEAIKDAHFPASLTEAARARERLSFDELLILQLAAEKRRQEWRSHRHTTPLKINGNKSAVDVLINSLPFRLTIAQITAVEQILADLSQQKPMNRLLQGDVGSGKTVVSAIAMYLAYLNGKQSLLMAPTEILAQQHYATISNLLSPFGVTVGLVTGSKKTTRITASYDILVGTHALLNEKIIFDDLSLVVIDEQQRFGVEQRGQIRQKGNNPHLLTMTATPIPRTVALAMYGDLDVSYINEMPTGRKKVKTWLVPPEKRVGAYNWIRKQCQETGSQAFVICPFIEESENMQTVKAASKEYDRLRHEVYPDLQLGLLHGKLNAREKEKVLSQFRNKKFDILVATPVVEVGIDIPDATVIMVEAAERFGLAQLHQLRGRVGRGEKQSYCLLFTENRSDTTTKRLKALETTHAGAELAELDLKLRGPGNLYGTAQHGIPKLKVASFSDTTLIKQAKHSADKIYPRLSSYPVLSEKVFKVSLQNVSPD